MARSTNSPIIHEASVREYQVALELAEQAPRPALAGRVEFGTAGWTDPTLLREGRFYPRGIKLARQRLEFYAQHFPFVEVDATYYALLPPTQAQQWLTYTPAAFTFNVKAHPVLTGQPFEVRRLPADLQDAMGDDTPGRVYADKLPVELAREIETRFRDFVEPLRYSGRLGAVLLQFPPWFVRSRGNVERIEQLAERWRDVPLAVEFRHPSWTDVGSLERTLELLTRLQLTWVCVDAPDGGEGDGGTTSPSTATQKQASSGGGVEVSKIAVTNPRLAMVRFHGQNVRGWAKKGASVHERFSYLYSPEELSPWASRLLELAAKAERVHATFNNCYRDYGVLNAKELAGMVFAAGGDEGADE